MRKPTPELTPRWGEAPWKIEFAPATHAIPEKIDVAIVGGGFTGLAAAAWLRRLAPEKSVAVFEASRIGAGASGRTGGMVLAESAAGDLPGLGDVLAGFEHILKSLGVDCDLSLPGVWEISRQDSLLNSPVDWNDSGRLRVSQELPGGTLDPGRLVSGLGRAAERLGAKIFENAPVGCINWKPARKKGAKILLAENAATPRSIDADKILLATNALSLDVSGYGEDVHPRLTLATLTAPISDAQLAAAGLGARKPFYTADLPYLWGRIRPDNSIVWGAGLVIAPVERDVRGADISLPETAAMFRNFQGRVRGLHPALREVRFTHHWGGPISFRDNWRPTFSWHPESKDAIVLGAYAGHGVALSSFLGAWAAEALLGERKLPSWGKF
jgi:glycine/D-amino acid oxidase-like deaminating enzyme